MVFSAVKRTARRGIATPTLSKATRQSRLGRGLQELRAHAAELSLLSGDLQFEQPAVELRDVRAQIRQLLKYMKHSFAADDGSGR